MTAELTYDQLSRRVIELETIRLECLGALRMARYVVKAAGRADELEILDSIIADILKAAPRQWADPPRAEQIGAS
jgi:hypothetical protein